MKVGMQVVFQNHEGHKDADMFRKEIQLAIEADAMGYDFVGFVEHHFTNYAMCPDNAQALSYVAAKTERITLMPAAFILPWNNPLRVVEKTILLDIQSEGRVMLGMGRGLAKCEYDGFGLDMAESRDRFDQSAEIILAGLESGYVEADTPFYKQPRVEIRPRPERSFKGRSFMVGMSPTSIEVAARLGLGCLKFSQGPWEVGVKDVETYRERFKFHHGKDAPAFIIADLVSCFPTEAKSNEYADKYMRRYYQSVLDFYEMKGDHFKNIPSYANYAAASEALKSTTDEQSFQGYLNANLVGTPEQIIAKHQARKAIVGDYDLSVNFTFGSMPYEDVFEQAKLFAEKVMPYLK